MKRVLRLVIFLFLAAACFGAGGLAFAGEPAPLKLKAGKELLVAKDVNMAPPVWCRGSDILAYETYGGLFYYDTKTGKTTFVAHKWNSPLHCTPDGEWLVYIDPVVEGPGRLLRYEFKTGKRQKFTAKGDASDVAFDEKPSPVTGKTKVYLYGDSLEVLGPIDPKWEVIRLKYYSTGVWFSDGSALIDFKPRRDAEKRALIVEIYKPERKTVEMPNQYQDDWISDILGTDKFNRLYLRIAGAGKDDRVDRCEVDLEGAILSCETVFDGNGQYDDLAFLSDMETMIFTRSGDTCVRAMRLGDDAEKANCITDSKYDLGNGMVLSPDEKWLALQVGRNDKEGKFEGVDLYIINLLKE